MAKIIFVLVFIHQCIGFIAAIDFFLYRRGDTLKLVNDLLPANFDRSKNNYVLLHGMGGSSQDGCIRNLSGALLQKQDANIIVPNYYTEAFWYTMSYQAIGKKISDVLKNNNVDPRRTTVIGHSLGAQISGILKNYGFKPHSIIGMDPAGPQFSAFPDSVKLSSQSANQVQAVHTNVGYLGSATQDGHLDVYINRGTDFPCCSTAVCRHIGACDWTASTIRSGPVYASACSTQTDATRGTCSSGTVLTGFGAPSATQGRTIAHVSLTGCVRRS